MTGVFSKSSSIVNAPWFREAAQICREHPEFDIGVHLHPEINVEIKVRVVAAE